MNPNMTPIDWAKRPIQKYADLNGRAARAEFWWWVLAIIVATIVTQIIDSILGMKVVGAYGPLTLILSVALIVPNIAVSVRRLHDTDRTGWWILLPIVPYCIALVLGGGAMLSGSMTGLGTAGIFLLIGAVCALVLLFFYVQPGTPGSNRYGPNPYEGGGVSAA